MLCRGVITVTVLVSIALQGAVGQFSIVPSNTTVNQNEPVEINCSYPNASSIAWERVGGAAITDATPGFSVEDLTPESSVLRIPSADPQVHTGSYACVATPEGGGDDERMPFTIMVQFLGEVTVDVIRDPCDGDSVYIGSNVRLDCIVQDSAPPVTTTTWFREGESMSPDIQVMTGPRVNFSGTMLVFTNISSAEDGLYFCQASNGPLAMNSSMMFIGHIEPPARALAIFQEGSTEALRTEEEIFVKDGERTALYCVVNTIHPPFRGPVWRINTSGIVSGHGGYALIVISPCNSSLSIDVTNTTHEGFYDCQIQGEIITSFKLTLARIPATYRITASPNTNSVGLNTTLMLRCFPDPPGGRGQMGNVEVIYSWQFVPSGGGQAVDVVASGNRILGNGTLILRELRFSDSGVYVCVAGNDLVTPVRTNYSLTVEDPLEVTIQPIAPLKLGFNISLSCSVVGPENISIMWTIGGRNVTPSFERLTSTFDGTSSTLHITRLTETELGKVSCRANHPHYRSEVATEQIQEVQEPYLIGDRTSNKLYVREGEPIVLVCPLRSRSSSITVKWFHGQLSLGISNPGAVVAQAANGSVVARLGVASVNEDDGDAYQCQVVEGSDRILTYTETIFVTVPAKLVDSPEDITTVEIGSFLELRCVVEGRPQPVVSWKHNQARITSPTIREFENGTLIFDPVGESDGGEYSCTTMQANQDFTLTRKTTLRVEEKSDEDSNGLPFSSVETILVFTVVGVVSFFLFFVLCPMLIAISCCCCCRRISEGKYSVNKHGIALDSGSLKQGSLPSGKDSSASYAGNVFDHSNPKFSPLPENPSPEPSFELGDRRFNNLPQDFHTFAPGVTGTKGRDTDGYASMTTDSPTVSPIRGTLVTPSQTSALSPYHTTMASTSLISSEEHTILENGLPHFPRNNVMLGELMGQGEFGPVMRATARNLLHGQPETEVAVKLLVTEEGGEGEEEGFRADLAVVDYANQMKLENRSIASILGICSDKEPYYVIYEYLDRGDLKNFLLQSRPEEGVPPKLMDHELVKMIGQVAEGMAYLFSQRIIHGDIATRNCLVSSSLQVKIGDLGIGHELYMGDYYDNGAQLLPIRWMPPELLTDSETGPSFSLHSDAWSFGVFCWEVMAYARLPYENYSDEEVLAMIPGGSRLRNPSMSCPSPLFLIMMDCWNEVPERRPQFTKILSQLATINLDL